MYTTTLIRNPYLNNALSIHLFAVPWESLELRRLRNKIHAIEILIAPHFLRYIQFIIAMDNLLQNNMGVLNAHFAIQM